MGVPLLAACSSDDEADGDGSAGFGALAVQLPSAKTVEFGGEYLAVEKGYFAAAGFGDVTLVAGPASVETAVTSGRVLVGVSAPTTTANAIRQGAPMKIIGAVFQTNPYCIVSLATNPITTPRDMLGKRIGVQVPNLAIFEGFMRANRLARRRLTIVPVQADPNVLTGGGVDGFFSTFITAPIALTAEGYAVSTLGFADHGQPMVAKTFTVLQESIDTQRAKLKAFLTAEARGWAASLADPKGAAELTVSSYGKDLKLDLAEQSLTAEAQSLLVETEQTRRAGLFTITDEAVAVNIEALTAAGFTITAEQIFDLSLLDEVYADDRSLI